MTLEEYEDTAAYVAALAERCGVVYVRTAACEFAETASRLVGDNLPPPDDTENLLVALDWAGVIDQQERVRLHYRHLCDLRKRGPF